MGQVAGNCNVVRFCPLQVVAENGKKDITLFGLAFQLPAQITRESFVEKITFFNMINTGEMRIGKVGKDKVFPGAIFCRLVDSAAEF